MEHVYTKARNHHARSLELKRQIFEARRWEGLNRKQIASRLGVSRQVVEYHLEFSETEEWSEVLQLRCDLADALTREKFYKDLVNRLLRQLLWKGEKELSGFLRLIL